MIRYLSEISELVTGYSFRMGVPYDAAGHTRVVQSADIQQNGSLPAPDQLRKIEISAISTASFLRIGDVVLVSRSSPGGSFRAASIDYKPPVPYVAASALTVIRPTSRKIEPAYLATYLNSGDSQVALQRMASGSSIKTLRLKELSEMPIPVPDIQTQRTLVALARNIHAQKALVDRRCHLLDALLSTITSANR
jgi:hypothetical protein